MAANTGKKPSYKWITEATQALIHFRAINEDNFLRSKQAPKKLWEQFIKEAGLVGKVEPQQPAKKWENLKTRYKELKNPKTGSGTDGGEETAATWQYDQDMHEVLGGRPSIDPPLLVASFTPNADPTTILLEIVDGPSNLTTTSAMVDAFSSSSTASTSASWMDLSSSMSPSSPPTPSPPKNKKIKNNTIVEFLKAESEREQRRHEESEAKTERFLRLFEQMVEKM